LFDPQHHSFDPQHHSFDRGALWVLRMVQSSNLGRQSLERWVQSVFLERSPEW
jgi:hypothetical protein